MSLRVKSCSVFCAKSMGHGADTSFEEEFTTGARDDVSVQQFPKFIMLYKDLLRSKICLITARLN